MDAPPTHNDQARSLEVDDNEWSKRSLHWLRQGASASPKDKRVRRRPSRDPLILAGHGVSLGSKPARSSFATASPTIRRSRKPIASSKAMPTSRHGSSCWTAAAHHVRRAHVAERAESPARQNRLDRQRGAVVSGESFAANRERVAWQTETRSDRRKRMEFCNALIAKKIEGCKITLETSLRRSQAWEARYSEQRPTLLALPTILPDR